MGLKYTPAEEWMAKEGLRPAAPPGEGEEDAAPPPALAALQLGAWPPPDDGDGGPDEEPIPTGWRPVRRPAPPGKVWVGRCLVAECLVRKTPTERPPSRPEPQGPWLYVEIRNGRLWATGSAVWKDPRRAYSVSGPPECWVHRR
jgi:hypothetical protein